MVKIKKQIFIQRRVAKLFGLHRLFQASDALTEKGS